MLTKNEALLLVDEAERLVQELESDVNRDEIRQQLFHALDSLRDVASPLLRERLPNIQAWTEALTEHVEDEQRAPGSTQTFVLEQLAEIRQDLDVLD